MQKILFSFLFFYVSLFSYYQNIEATDIDNLSKKISDLDKQKSNDSALYYSDKLLSKSIALNDTIHIIEAYNNLAKFNRYKKNYLEAVRNYMKSKEFNLLIGDTNSAVIKLRRIAMIQNILGDYNSTENTSIEALEFTESLPDSISRQHKLGLYNELGITSRKLDNLDDAINWYYKALEINQKAITKITIKNNIAVLHIEQKKYNLALEMLSNLIKEPILLEEPKSRARIMDNLANVKAKLKYPEAEKELITALEIRREIDDLEGQFTSSIHLIEFYLDQGENQIALNFAKEAYKISKKTQNINSEIEALSYLIKLKDNSNEEAREYIRITDSLMTARNQAKNQFAKIRYEADKYREQVLVEQKTNAQQEVAIEKQKNHKLILIALISLLVPTIGLVIYYLIQKSKTDRIKERHSTEKRLSKKLHDEVGNDVFYLMSQLINETETSPNANKNNVIQGLDAVYHKVRDFSRDNTVETGPEYEYELRSLLNSYGNDKTRIITNKLENDFWSVVSDYKKTELYWILKELLTNMKKHSEATIVSINITKEKKTIIVKYADNGKGTDFSKLSQKMNGLNNVRNRIKDIKGTITFDTIPNKGFKSVIKFSL